MKLIRQIMARYAARYLARKSSVDHRRNVRAVARQLCKDMGRPVPKVLRR